MTREVFRWVALTAAATTLVPLFCFSISWKRQPKHHLILAISLVISFVFDVIGSTLAYHQITNVLPHNLYHIIAFPAIMWFYHETLINRSFKILVRIFIVGFLIIALVFAFDQGLNVLNHTTWTISSILTMIVSLLFVADLSLMSKSNFETNQFHQTNIILNTSLAIYYFVTIVWFSLSDYVFSNFSYEDVRYFWSFHNLAHGLKNIGIAVAFYLCTKRSNSLNNS